MPSISWALSTPAAAPATAAPTIVGQATLPCPVVAITQDEFLALIDRLLPYDYLAGLKNPGPGYEAIQAMAAVGVRLSQAVERFGCAAYILTSSAGATSTGFVEFYRPAANTEGITVTLKKGTVVKSSQGGRRFVTTQDQVWAPTDLGPYILPIAAEVQDYSYNETGAGVAFDGASLPGEIDTVVTLLEDPDMGDLTFAVRQHAALTGGLPATLDQHGADRLVFRSDGETDGAYASRIRGLPDNISPDSFSRILQQLLLPYTDGYQLIETWDIAYQTCWDCPPVSSGSLDPLLFVYDDPRPATPTFRGRWLDTSDFRGGVILVVPDFGPVLDLGMAYDDTATSAAILSNPDGSRALGAYDVPESLAFGYTQGALDGYDSAKAGIYKKVYNTLQASKAAGVSFSMELLGQ
jgi:hypothetical protein